MIRSCDARSIAFALVAGLAVAVTPAAAGADAKPAPVAGKTGGADAAVCTDGTPTAAERAAREAKLADLGRRLHAEAAVQRDIQVLNRTGLNYSDRRLPPAAPAPAPHQP